MQTDYQNAFNRLDGLSSKPLKRLKKMIVGSPDETILIITAILSGILILISYL